MFTSSTSLFRALETQQVCQPRKRIGVVDGFTSILLAGSKCPGHDFECGFPHHFDVLKHDATEKIRGRR